MSQDANPKQHNGHGHIQPVRGQAVQGVAAPDAEEVMARVDVPDDGGTALRGYDVVSYETGAPVKGDSAHEVFTENVRWGRVRYVFSSAENAAKFKAGHLHDYAPAYGGFCATGAFSGYCSLSRLISERDEGRPTLRDFLILFFSPARNQTPRPALAGVSHGELWHADPTIFKIFNGKLYIFCCPAAKAHFDNSTEPSIAAATKTWNAWTKTPVDFANKARSLSRRSPHDRVRAVRAVP